MFLDIGFLLVDHDKGKLEVSVKPRMKLNYLKKVIFMKKMWTSARVKYAKTM